MFRELTIRAALLRGIEPVAREVGLNVTALLESVHFDRRYLENPEARLSALSVCKLLERASSMSGIGDFGLRIVMQQGAPDFGPLALLLREEPDVRAALHSLGTHLAINTDAFDVRLIEEDGEAILAQVFRLDKVAQGRQLVELTCARLVQIIRLLISPTWRPNLVCFAHSAGTLPRSAYTLFRCPVEYGHDFTGVVLKPSDIETPLNGANSDARRYAEAYLRSLRVGTRLNFGQRVESIILGLLPGGAASADRTAAQLGITRRTLNRKLAECGHSYSSLLQSIRTEIVHSLIEQQEIPLSEIATELGFRSLSAFSMWFRQTFGASPSSWRRQHQAIQSEIMSLAPDEWQSMQKPVMD
ncbi:MAG: AraC family transcriptional regulator [Sphingomonadales bacterium]|nr:MAG: AraC family transcriptional regulator [Sphingomonadales bacterium]